MAPGVLEGLLVERAIILKEASLIDVVLKLHVVLAVVSVTERLLGARLSDCSALAL